MAKTYVRDGRAPIPEREVTSRIMSQIKGKNTQPELLLRKRLWKEGLRGYRTHWKKAPGKPDICFVRRKVAVFVHGCYWHRCPFCKLNAPKSHPEYWREKFRKNVERDERHKKELKRQCWKYIIAWECQIKKRPDSIIDRIKTQLDR